MNTSSQQRLQDLESRFIELEEKLSDTPEKEAISVLHAMVQEGLRGASLSPSQNDGNSRSGVTMVDWRLVQSPNRSDRRSGPGGTWLG